MPRALRSLQLLLLPITVLPFLGCGSDRPILSAARTYMERRIAGDVVPIRDMLSTSDRHAADQAGYPDNLPAGVGISRAGMIGAKLDSVVRIGTLTGDSAMVGVYLNAPNYEQALGAMILGAMSGALQGGSPDTATLSRQLREQAGSLPRVTVVDTLRLVREGGSWRIALALPQRIEMAKAFAPIRDSYLEEPLAVRAADAERFLTLARKYRGYASSTMIAEAEKLVRDARLASALRFSVRSEAGYFSASLRGRVTNPNGTRLQEVWLELRDGAGERRTITVSSIPAGGTAEVFEPFSGLREGPVVVHVLALKLPGEDN